MDRSQSNKERKTSAKNFSDNKQLNDLTKHAAWADPEGDRGSGPLKNHKIYGLFAILVRIP